MRMVGVPSVPLTADGDVLASILVALVCLTIALTIVQNSLFSGGSDDSVARTVEDSVDAEHGLAGPSRTGSTAGAGGATVFDDDISLTLQDGREFDQRALQAVERARVHCRENPEVTARAAVRAATGGTDDFDARSKWESTVRPGLKALTDVDVSALEARSSPSVVGTAAGNATVESETRSSGEAGAESEDAASTVDSNGGDAAGSAGVPDDPLVGRSGPVPANLGGIAPEGSFEVEWIDPGERTIRVTDEAMVGTFTVVDRNGALAVRPSGNTFDRASSPPREWLVAAANALESALPGTVDALEEPGSAWPTDRGGMVAPKTVAAFEATVLAATETGYRLSLTDGSRSCEVLVDGGVASFPNEDDYGVENHWRRHALAAAEAFMWTLDR